MTYLRGGIEYLDRREMAVYRAVCQLASRDRAANNSQVANASGVSRTTTAYITATLEGRGYIRDASDRQHGAYRWRPTGKEAVMETDTGPAEALYPPDPDGRPGYSRHPQEWDQVTHRLSGLQGAVYQLPDEHGVMTVVFAAGMVSRMHAGCFVPVTDESGAVLGTGARERRTLMNVVDAFRARELRHRQVQSMAGQLGIDPVALDKGTTAAWSHMNPQTFSWEQALSLAGAVLKASGMHAAPF